MKVFLVLGQGEGKVQVEASRDRFVAGRYSCMASGRLLGHLFHISTLHPLGGGDATLFITTCLGVAFSILSQYMYRLEPSQGRGQCLSHRSEGQQGEDHHGEGKGPRCVQCAARACSPGLTPSSEV